MISDTIKMLREQSGLSQVQLAKKLNTTRSSVCAWEQGLSCPTAQFIVQLAALFHVSTDYLLGLTSEQSVSLSGLNEEERKIIQNLVQYFDRDKR